MIDFVTQQKNVKEYIQANMPLILEELGLSDFDAYIDDYVDLDSYKKSKQMFFDFDSYDFDYLSNESETLQVGFTIYLSFIGQKASELKTNMLVYTAALHKLFEDSGNNFGGIFDYGIILSDHFYSAAEGDKNKKVAEINFQMNVES